MGGPKIYLLIQCILILVYVNILLSMLSLSLFSLAFLSTLGCILFGALLKFSLPPAEEGTFAGIFGEPRDTFHNLDVAKQSSKIVKLVAHRACGLDAPENSLGALKKVIKEGIVAVEFDVMLTADNIPVVFHDDSLSRMTSDARLLHSVTFEELQKLDISLKHPFGKHYPGEKIPSLEDFVKCCIDNDIRMIIDLKNDDFNLVPVIVKVFEAHPRLVDLAVVSSFNPILIYKIRAQNPQIAGCLAWRPYFFSHKEYSWLDGPLFARTNNPLLHWCHRILNIIYEWFLWRFLYHFLGISLILLHKDMITRQAIDHWKKRRVRVMAWTVNLPSEKAFFEKALRIPYLTDTVIAS